MSEEKGFIKMIGLFNSLYNVRLDENQSIMRVVDRNDPRPIYVYDDSNNLVPCTLEGMLYNEASKGNVYVFRQHAHLDSLMYATVKVTGAFMYYIMFNLIPDTIIGAYNTSSWLAGTTIDQTYHVGNKVVNSDIAIFAAKTLDFWWTRKLVSGIAYGYNSTTNTVSTVGNFIFPGIKLVYNTAHDTAITVLTVFEDQIVRTFIDYDLEQEIIEMNMRKNQTEGADKDSQTQSDQQVIPQISFEDNNGFVGISGEVPSIEAA